MRRPRPSAASVALAIPAALVWAAAVVWQARVVLRYGRGSYDLGYDDVVYALDGKRAIADAAAHGFLPTVGDWIVKPPHAPFLEAYSFAVQDVFGANQEALYVSLAILLAIGSVAFACALATNWFIRFAVAGVVAASPIGFLTANEYRPDVFYVLIAMCAIAFMARTTLRAVPARADTRFLPPVCFGIALLFLKPPWILLTVGLFIGLLSAILVSSLSTALEARAGERVRYFLIALWTAIRIPLLLVAVTGAIWAVWLGRATYDYLFGARDHPYFFAASSAEALRQTYASTMAYLGDSALPAVYAATCVSALLAIFLMVRLRFGRRQVLDLVLLATPLLSIAFVVLATAAAEHPSPFQGIYIYGVIFASAASILAYLATSSSRVLGRRSRRSATLVAGLVLLAVVGAFVHHDAPVRAVPPMFADPNRAETRVAQTIGAACQPRGLTAETNAPGREISVLVAPIEDMTWEGVEYYLPSSPAAGPAFAVVTPNPMTSAPAELIDFAHQADVIVVSPANYEANRIPSNMLLHDLYEALLRDPGYRQLSTGLPSGSYAVFAKRSVCGARG